MRDKWSKSLSSINTSQPTVYWKIRSENPSKCTLVQNLKMRWPYDSFPFYLFQSVVSSSIPSSHCNLMHNWISEAKMSWWWVCWAKSMSCLLCKFRQPHFRPSSGLHGNTQHVKPLLCLLMSKNAAPSDQTSAEWHRVRQDGGRGFTDWPWEPCVIPALGLYQVSFPLFDEQCLHFNVRLTSRRKLVDVAMLVPLNQVKSTSTSCWCVFALRLA